MWRASRIVPKPIKETAIIISNPMMGSLTEPPVWGFSKIGDTIPTNSPAAINLKLSFMFMTFSFFDKHGWD